MLRIVACDSARARAMARRSPFTRVTPALSIATSVPVPMAMPTSAAASAGASLMPSPAMATTFPSARRRFTASALSAGSSSARTSSMPSSAPTFSAAALLSPVSMTTRTPDARRAASASGVDALIGSSIEIVPNSLPSTASMTGRWKLPRSTPFSFSRRAVPRIIFLPSTVPLTPRPASARKSLTGLSCWRRSSAASTIMRAIGCSLPRSSEAASRSISMPPVTLVMRGLPSVSVPVLSITSVSTFSSRSSASALRIRIPAAAPRPTPTMIDIGVASPSAQGQAMISTDTAAISA